MRAGLIEQFQIGIARFAWIIDDAEFRCAAGAQCIGLRIQAALPDIAATQTDIE